MAWPSSRKPSASVVSLSVQAITTCLPAKLNASTLISGPVRYSSTMNERTPSSCSRARAAAASSGVPTSAMPKLPPPSIGLRIAGEATSRRKASISARVVPAAARTGLTPCAASSWRIAHLSLSRLHGRGAGEAQAQLDRHLRGGRQARLGQADQRVERLRGVHRAHQRHQRGRGRCSRAGALRACRAGADRPCAASGSARRRCRALPPSRTSCARRAWRRAQGLACAPAGRGPTRRRASSYRQT